LALWLGRLATISGLPSIILSSNSRGSTLATPKTVRSFQSKTRRRASRGGKRADGLRVSITLISQQSRRCPRVERAYISGGANFPTRTLYTGDIQADASRLVVTINNYGKTPAFIGTVAVATCDKLEPKFSGPWQRQEWKGYVLPAPTHDLLSDVDCNYEKDKIIFGRIWYRDIFMKCHSCGFALYMREGLPAVPGHDAYWEDRDEPDLGPAAP
jgi:hypothetical protein